MTSPIRILDTGLKSARWNVAMTAALARAACRRRGARYHPLSSLSRDACCSGARQRAAEAVDLEHCRLRGIEIVHRVTGGGAVYMSPRMPAWDVVIDRGSLTGDLGTATRRICEGVAGGLSRLGCVARLPARQRRRDRRPQGVRLERLCRGPQPRSARHHPDRGRRACHGPRAAHIQGRLARQGHLSRGGAGRGAVARPRAVLRGGRADGGARPHACA